MDSLLEQFLQEARENLAFIDQHIEEISPNDPELLNSIFRAAHTLKGGSGIVGFDSVKDITHYAEDLLDMLRSGKIEFKNSMKEALFDAFDEVMNLIEAAEESGNVVEANQNIVTKIITKLNQEMGKNTSIKQAWKIPFTLVEDVEHLINIPLSILRNINSIKLPFKNLPIDEMFCTKEQLFAIIFDVDSSCMVYGNDPLYALSLLEEKVLGVFTCMTDENSKSILSGMEDEDGLLLKSYMVAYVYGKYEHIEDSLFNFIDELQLLPLDIASLLCINIGEKGHKLDLLKELSSLSYSHGTSEIVAKIKKSIELVGKDTIQYAQLQRFLDIANFITENELSQLNSFFTTLYKGEVYTGKENTQAITPPQEETPKKETSQAPVIQPIEKTVVEMNEHMKSLLLEMIKQQYESLRIIAGGDEIERVSSILDTLRKFIPQMPKKFESKDDIIHFLKSQLSIPSEPKPQAPIEQKPIEPKTIPQPAKEKIVNEEILNNEDLFTQEDAPTRNSAKRQDASSKSVVGKTVKIEQESIDSLMNVVGELLVAKNSLPYLADNVFDMTPEMIKRGIMEKYIFINRLSEQLQDLIMSMRMLPISYVFDRYPKLVRDISKKLDKKVNLEMDGGETKLDKNMIEMLADPMIHIMRNSLDHGIETPEVRSAKGKNPEGTVRLHAYAESDKIIIDIIDDGAGIDIEKLTHKVLEKGLLSIDQIDTLTEDERAELVLLPGLSTADTISEFSGRGVGMDVVKKSIEGFGGTIKIKTKKNRGTTITLSIPVSLAVTSLLHIQMNDINYGVPMDSVSETVKLQRDKIEYLHNEPFIYIRGEVIPLLFIKAMLSEDSMKDDTLSIVILNIKNNLLAVVVNKFLGQLDVVQKPLAGIFEHHPIFTGTALLGNGQIIMAIDPIGLLGISQKLKTDIKAA